MKCIRIISCVFCLLFFLPFFMSMKIVLLFELCDFYICIDFCLGKIIFLKI
jgi:hypothetical protein